MVESALREAGVSTEALLRYHLLKLALERFGRRPAELERADRAQAEKGARRSLDIEERVLASAEARNLFVPPHQVEAALAEVSGRYGSREEMAEDLAANGLDESILREALHRELRFDGVMARVSANHAVPSDLDVEIYFQLNREKFRRPEIRTVRHVLVTVNPDYQENQRPAALARIRRLQRELAEAPERFAELAQQHSECPTALQGGLIGEVPRGKLYPALDKALFALEAGVVSGVLESEAGFHVLLCEAVQPSEEVPLAEAAGKIRALLEERLRRNCQKIWLKDLMAGANEP